METIEVGEGEGSKGTPDSATLTSPTIKKEKDIKREKDIKKESIKTEHRDPAHRTKDTKMAESELVRDLKAQLKYVGIDIKYFLRPNISIFNIVLFNLYLLLYV